MRRSFGWVLAVVLLVGALLAPGAAAKVRYPRLAAAFGTGGYVSLAGKLPGPATEPLRLEGLAAAPGGAVYATETSLVGGSCNVKCLYRGFLARVDSDGSVAATFGGSGRVEVASGIEAVSPPISDPEGRALIASIDGSSVTVRRFLADGSADASFASGGMLTVDCGCGTVPFRQLRLAVDGQGRIVVSISTPSGYSYSTAGSTLARLLPNGALDTGFGSNGVLQLAASPSLLGIAFGSGNAIYTWGSPCCGSSQPFLHRISAKGRIDTEFDAQADATLANVRARGTLETGRAVLVVRPHGLLDYYGGERLLRLRVDGKAEAKFGNGGVRKLSWSVVAAMLAGHGKVLGLGESSAGISLIRLRSGGRPDPSFGRKGARLIEGVSAEGGHLGLARLNGRRAQVIDDGAMLGCRQICAPSPTLVRFRIGPKP